MYPLLVTGLTSVAGQVIDKFHEISERKAATAQANAVATQAQFQQLLGRAAAAQAPVSPQVARDNRLSQLRKELQDSPEVQTALATSDPSKPPTITASADGKVTLTTADGRSREIQLSPETQAKARDLAKAEAEVSAPPLLSARLRKEPVPLR